MYLKKKIHPQIFIQCENCTRLFFFFVCVISIFCSTLKIIKTSVSQYNSCVSLLDNAVLFILNNFQKWNIHKEKSFLVQLKKMIQKILSLCQTRHTMFHAYSISHNTLSHGTLYEEDSIVYTPYWIVLHFWELFALQFGSQVQSRLIAAYVSEF